MPYHPSHGTFIGRTSRSCSNLRSILRYHQVGCQCWVIPFHQSVLGPEPWGNNSKRGALSLLSTLASPVHAASAEHVQISFGGIPPLSLPTAQHTGVRNCSILDLSFPIMGQYSRMPMGFPRKICLRHSLIKILSPLTRTPSFICGQTGRPVDQCPP